LFGDGYYISNINAGNVATTKIVNGGSYANIPVANGNVTIAVGSTSDVVATFYDQGLIVNIDASVGGNILAGAAISAFGDITAGGNVVGGNVNVTTAVSAGGNVYAATDVSAGGNVVGGNVTATTNVSAGGNVNSNNVNSTNNVSAGGNVYGANFATTGSGGNITGANVVSATTFTAGGNITGGNIIFGTGDVTGTGNVFAGYISTSGNVRAGQDVKAYGNVSANGTVSGGNVYATDDVSAGGNVYATTNVSAGANVVGGNIVTSGYVTAIGDVHGGNIFTANAVSAGGDVTGGNVYATTDVSAGSNVTGGNVNTNFLNSNGSDLQISASGTNAGISLLTNGGNIGAGTNWINAVKNPVQDQDAATKYYVDTVAQGLTVKNSVGAAETTYLANVANVVSVTYNQPNGAGNGVGATLTLVNTGNVVIDGVNITAETPSANTRILISQETGSGANDTNAAWNGIYTLTAANTTATVLTRSLDMEIATEFYGAFTFVYAGNTWGNTGWVCTNNADSSPITLGVTPITWSQFSGAANYTQGNGILIQGQVISTRVNTGNLEYDGSGNLQVSSSAQFTTPDIGSATGAQLSVTGNVSSNNLFFTTQISSGGNVFAGYVSVSGNVDANNVNGNVFATTVSASGTVTGGNISTAGSVTASTNVSAGGNIAGGNVLVTTNVSAGGNITGGNLFTTGTNGNISGTGWVFAGNASVSGNVLAGGDLSVSGNILNSANISTAGNITATGNIGSAAYLFGDGYYISNINAGNVNTTKIVSGGSYANVITPNGNVVIAVGTGSNIVATFYDTGVNLNGDTSAGGNILAGAGISAFGDVTAGGNVVGGNVNVTTAVSAGGNVVGGNILATGYGAISTGGNITADINISAGANVIGGNVLVTTTVSAGGNIYSNTDISAGGNVIANTDVTAGGNVNANNVNATNLVSAVGNIQAGTTFLVDTTDNTVLMGNVTNSVTESVLTLNSTNSMVVPVGTTGQRPVTPYTGMMRFNTTLNQMEIYNNSEWAPVGQTNYTVITDQQFDGDGATVTFTLSTPQTTNSCIVSINGVVQIPTLAYAVSGTTLTFTEAPAVGDVIDVRELTTTTTVTYITNQSGNATVTANYAAAEVDIVGNLVATLSATAPSLTANSTVSFQLVNNTTLAFVVRGTDGVTRTATVTLA
jgi:filamentous hemagglutinin